MTNPKTDKKLFFSRRRIYKRAVWSVFLFAVLLLTVLPVPSYGVGTTGGYSVVYQFYNQKYM